MYHFNNFKRQLDPLCGPGKKCSLVPVKARGLYRVSFGIHRNSVGALCMYDRVSVWQVAATIALHRGNKIVLQALEHPIPG